MIYLDSSVLLAEVFAEQQVPPKAFWFQSFHSSRLLEYEVFNRVHVRGTLPTHVAGSHNLLGRVTMLEMAPHILARALLPFPVPVRTLDGLHLATMEFLRRQGQTVELATYDQRLLAAATALGFAAANL